MEKRIYEVSVKQRAINKYSDIMLTSEIVLAVDNTEDVEVITNLMMKYAIGEVEVTTKCKNYVEESEE